MTPLTDSQINEALALGMGWRKGKRIGGDAWLDNMNSCVYLCDEFWDKSWHPCSSLDQMHIVETRIIELGLQVEYEMFLLAELGISLANWKVMDLFKATARQKALAAVKTFGEVGK